MSAIKLVSIIMSNVQQPMVPLDDLVISPNFFLTIFAGVVLSLAFQFILTAISAAVGVSAIGDIKENYIKSKVDPFGNEVREEDNQNANDAIGITTGVKINFAFGIWSVVTSCIALFGATALSLNLSVVESSITNVVTSLIIWSMFFLLLFIWKQESQVR